jgi:hypothetical protein
MSYILDALKKSEQQRGHGNIPDVQTVHSAGLNYRSEKKALWPYILVAAVLLNFAAIVYFIYDRSYLSDNQHADDTFRGMQRIPVSTDQMTAETPVQQATPLDPPATVKTGAAVTDAETKPGGERLARPEAGSEPDTDRTPASKTKTGVTASQATVSEAIPAEAPASDQIIPYYDLPESIRGQLPAILISAHVYSSNPRQRSIVINNNFMEEGEYLIDDVILYEITRDGAIFSYHGTLFSYGVVSSWQ